MTSMSWELLIVKAVNPWKVSALFPIGIDQAERFSQRKENGTMTKTLDIITEIIRNTKHPFRKADDRPVKAQKRRYERRKIREFIRLGDWAQENPA